MKQKYVILKNNKENELIIKEFAELNKDTFTLMCEETFHDKLIESAINKGSQALIATLRTKNMYPNGIYAAKIAEEAAHDVGSHASNKQGARGSDSTALGRLRRLPYAFLSLERHSLSLVHRLVSDVDELHRTREWEPLRDDDVLLLLPHRLPLRQPFVLVKEVPDAREDRDGSIRRLLPRPVHNLLQIVDVSPVADP